MAIVVERETLHPTRAVAALGELGWLAVAGSASLSAGAIHAAAVGVHSEHRAAVVTFTVVAAVQLVVGALALTRANRRIIALGAVANVVLIGGWVLAKTNGISFVAGLDEAETPQLADSLAVGLAVVAVLGAVAYLLSLGSRSLLRSPLLTGGSALLVASMAVPGMLYADTHQHEAGAADGHAAHGTTEEVAAAPASAVPPKPYDPALPLDLGGVEGVSLQEQAAAENLLAITIVRLPKFSDVEAVEAMGFRSIGDGFLGHEHFLNVENMNDDRLLDPDYPESLVFDTSVTPKKLVAAMFMTNPGDSLADVPALGGKLTQWHIHDNLCFAPSGQVRGLTDATGGCGVGLVKGPETPMIHVWIEPHPCGPFAALEGVAGGSVPEGEARLCDHAHG